MGSSANMREAFSELNSAFPGGQHSNLAEEMLSCLEANFVDFDQSSQVANFYANRSVFITGATGFIGKVIKRSLHSSEINKRAFVHDKLMKS